MQSLSSERFLLRLPEAQDLAVYRAFFSDAEASRFYGGPLRDDQSWRALAGHVGHWHLRGYGLWMIVPKQGGPAIGGCGFVWPDGWPRRELTWWLLPEARGTGAAVEVSKVTIKHAYDNYGWPLVETHMDDANAAARKLVQKLGGEVIAREVFPDDKTRSVYVLPRQE
ncbi:GNAT family N-acetyltransferase [uncultured Roseibium sp.]|uniref:GNAT family N-acetyltransferase n=1 Tax=uncultured Roseibium sp. TaxID=1936171 RepID=UPI002621FE72|nr:GNAT family N-acetyltransferase [uncultured Roseibium sp.]